MSSRSTEQQQEIDTRRFIFGCYARSFSPPRIQKLADAITDLDRLAACSVAVEIDHAIGAFAAEKLLSQLGCCRESAITTKQRQLVKGQKK